VEAPASGGRALSGRRSVTGWSPVGGRLAQWNAPLVSGGHITISGCQSLSQSFADTSYKLDILENTRFPVGISMLSIVVPEIEVFPVWAAILLLPVAPCCRSHLGTLL